MPKDFVFIMVTAISVIAIISFFFYMDSYSCAEKALVMGKSKHWSVSTGCMIEYKKDEWIPINQYRVID